MPLILFGWIFLLPVADYISNYYKQLNKNREILYDSITMWVKNNNNFFKKASSKIPRIDWWLPEVRVGGVE